MPERRVLRTDYLARVEGEGAMTVRLDGDSVEHVELRIFEPPRFFEALLRGRSFLEAPDLTARICGICPVAYQTSSVNALESLCGVDVPEPIRILRRLLYCGEWIESHALHIVMLHAPDFLGFPDAIQMAREHGDAVRRGLALKKTGNELMRLLGGREIHPVNVKVGGFYRVPRRDELAPVTENLQRARDLAVDLVRWVASFDFPEFERDYEFVALRHPEEYPFNEGRLVSTRGIDIGVKAEFYEMIGELAASGRAILLISSELPELLALSDRVLVMSEGRLTADLPRGQATEESVMQAAVPRAKATARAAA